MAKKTNRLLLLILAVGAFFRLTFLSSAPPSLNWDEASIGYNAYSILKTSRDEWGKLLPLSFKAFGEYKLPAMIYATVPFVAIFGLNTFSIRLVAAVAGILTIYSVYLLVKSLFSEKHALFAAAVLSILPWHIHLSRSAFEATLGLLFFTLTLYHFSLIINDKRKYLPFTVFAVLSIYTYNSLRIFLPLLIMLYIFLYRKKLFSKKEKTNKLVLSLAAITLSSLPIIYSYTNSASLIRLNVVSFWSRPAYINSIEVLRNSFTGPLIISKILYNRYTFFSYNFLKNLLSHYSPNFLFLKGDSYTLRSTQGYGLFHIYEVIPLILAVKVLLTKYRSKLKFLFPLLALPAIPSSLTINAPSALQSINLIPGFILLESLGLVYLYSLFMTLKSKKRIIALSISGLVILFSLSLYSNKLFWQYPREYALDWQYGYQELFTRISDSGQQFTTIYITTQYGEPYIFTLFYNKFDPLYYQTSPTVDKNLDPEGWVHVNSLDNYKFADLKKPEFIPADLLQMDNVLVVAAPGEVSSGEIQGIIKDPGGKVSFELYSSTEIDL